MTITLKLTTGEKLHCSNCARWVEGEKITFITSDLVPDLVTEVLCVNCAEET